LKLEWPFAPAFRDSPPRSRHVGGTAQVSAFLPGVGEAIGIAVEHRMRITFPMVLLSTRDFGDWTRYLPRNPGFM
jgi:hypothetical protein